MFSTFYQKIGQLIRNLLPFETTLALLLLGVLIWPIPFIGAISPSLVLIAVYYWSAYRPDLFRPLPVFCIGLLNDAIHYLPLGLSAFIFLAIQQLVT
ncbi:MAG: rod shape-determining protein MreD, partial [Bdellovibrionales bacterium]